MDVTKKLKSGEPNGLGIGGNKLWELVTDPAGDALALRLALLAVAQARPSPATPPACRWPVGYPAVPAPARPQEWSRTWPAGRADGDLRLRSGRGDGEYAESPKGVGVVLRRSGQSGRPIRRPPTPRRP